ncbi:flagellar hook-length control protein FliK [Peptoanaerobacter stomatis]|uniref:Flagellar hook-length control protein FliK n=1 Tax=Peptoanaerobacter stomatis TaxID=796937 RepID=J4W6Q0_9FIRM|nr:flagellar hook-length control protein FliK [Peptoanaerobacter stomatis]EJU21591.1 flagellar hook-length control protein FliK [Peptoanaerobacter stomatis]NWO24741.1 flagellar hook-length control protein FliK [Peptostreptococcaceae bacterium oral taxon 081]
MEKITQTSVSSSASSAIMDLSKNLVNNNKADITKNSFKDYIKPVNSNQKYEYKKKEDYRQNEVKKDDKNQRVQDGDNNTDKMSDKKNIQNKNEKQEDAKTNLKDEVKKSDNTNSDKKDVSSKKEELKKDVQEEDQKAVEDIDTESIQNVLNIIINFSNDLNETKEQLENIPKEQLEEIKTSLDNFKEIPTELKDKLSKLIEKLESNEKLEDDLISDINSPDISKQIVDFKKIFDQTKLVKEDTVVNKEDFQVSINQELSDLKNEFNMSKNLKNIMQSNVSQSEDIENTSFKQDEVYDSNINITDVKIIGNTNRIFNSSKVSVANPQQIQNFSKIIDEMRIAFRDDKTTLNIKLEPETLGKLSIKIHSENGVLSASFFVESDKAKQAIENQMQLLVKSLTDRNINVQDINVQVGQNNEDLNYHKNIMEAINFSKRDSIDKVDMEEFDSIINPYLQEDLFNDLI